MKTGPNPLSNVWYNHPAQVYESFEGKIEVEISRAIGVCGQLKSSRQIIILISFGHKYIGLSGNVNLVSIKLDCINFWLYQPNF